VPDNLCETKVPPVKDLGDGHKSLCWLDDDVLSRMEPVIRFDVEHASHVGVPEDAPHGSGPGFIGEPPKRPHGKNATVAAGDFGEDAEEAETAAHARAHEHRDVESEPHDADDHSRSAPFAPRTVGEGRQSEDEDVSSAFEPTEEENEEATKKKPQ
jgi:peptide/nickel transport system ATP-binding protein